MSGSEGGFDLLRRATQAMMSKSATATDEDGSDQLGYDTPRSGFATPQPDLHDKRLPGIMSYFGQSGPTTPTRAMSAAQPTQAEQKSPSKLHTDSVSASGRATPSTSPPGGAQAPSQKGKLTIRIMEAKGLRKSRDPYVVAVFQRSELISPGPRTFADEDEMTPPAPMLGGGGIPIQRQGSDSGRPMAIPMRSRQSSNTSVTDHNTFRNRIARRSFTNPKWDAEAVFDVVESDMLVDISVYDHGANGEEFLGHVDFQATQPGKDEAVKGWFALRGNADTMAENTPTGEI